MLCPEVRSGQRGTLSAVSTESDVLAVDPELTSAPPDSHGSQSPRLLCPLLQPGLCIDPVLTPTVWLLRHFLSLVQRDPPRPATDRKNYLSVSPRPHKLVG